VMRSEKGLELHAARFCLRPRAIAIVQWGDARLRSNRAQITRKSPPFVSPSFVSSIDSRVSW
jgi:hypothetical protein